MPGIAAGDRAGTWDGRQPAFRLVLRPADLQHGRQSHFRKAGGHPVVHVINRQRHERLDRAGLVQLAQATLEAVLGPRLAAAVDVNLVFIGDNAMRQLNHTYRGLDAPTDVLSFVHLELPSPYTHRPAQREAWFFSQPVAGLNGERPLLGEVLIATPTARRYAERHALTCAEEIQRLVIHGIIHLCGYDHETDTGQMTRLERRLRRRFLYAATNAPPAHQP